MGCKTLHVQVSSSLGFSFTQPPLLNHNLPHPCSPVPPSFNISAVCFLCTFTPSLWLKFCNSFVTCNSARLVMDVVLIKRFSDIYLAFHQKQLRIISLSILGRKGDHSSQLLYVCTSACPHPAVFNVHSD